MSGEKREEKNRAPLKRPLLQLELLIFIETVVVFPPDTIFIFRNNVKKAFIDNGAADVSKKKKRETWARISKLSLLRSKNPRRLSLDIYNHFCGSSIYCNLVSISVYFSSSRLSSNNRWRSHIIDTFIADSNGGPAHLMINDVMFLPIIIEEQINRPITKPH